MRRFSLLRGWTSLPVRLLPVRLSPVRLLAVRRFLVAALGFAVLSSVVFWGAAPSSADVTRADLCPLFSPAAVATNDRFGSSIGIQDETAVIGAWLADADGASDSGAAYVFTADPDGQWSEGQRLVPSVPQPEAAFGFSTDLDGDILVIGAQNERVGASGDAATGSPAGGAVYVFERDAGGSWSERARLVLEDPAEADMFGHNVAVDASSATIVVGAPGRDSVVGETKVEDAGAAYVFTRSPAGEWELQASLVDPSARPGDRAGNDVGLSGRWAAVGHHLNDRVNGRNVSNAGGVLVYGRDGSGWSEPTRLIGSDAAVRDRAGIAVAIDQDVLVISGWAQGPGDPAVAWVFRETEQGWVEQQRIEPDQIEAAESHYGRHIELNAGVLVIGASMSDAGQSDGGAVHVYSERDGVWTEDTKLIPAGTGPGYQAGIALGLSDQWLAVGAERAELGARNGGGACLVPLADAIGQWSAPAPFVSSAPVAVNREDAGGVFSPVIGQPGSNRRRLSIAAAAGAAGILIGAGGGLVLMRRRRG